MRGLEFYEVDIDIVFNLIYLPINRQFFTYKEALYKKEQPDLSAATSKA